MAKILFVVFAKEQPHKGYLCDAETVKKWCDTIEKMGDTPDVMRIIETSIEAPELPGHESEN